jgi:hypothetical protein
VYTEVMEEIVSYSFAVDIYKTDAGTYAYGVFQELESETEDDLQLLETGEADTLAEAADMASKSIRTLFSV